MSHTICIEITETQLRVIKEACNLLSHVMIGNVHVAGEYLPNAEQFREIADEMQNWRGAKLSISSREIGDDARVAYDMYQVIKGGCVINYSLQPLIKLKRS